MVQFGPSDYSMSIGVSRQTAGERVREAETYVIETAHRMGVPARVELGDASGAARYLEMGVRHFCVGWDVGILHRWFGEQGKAMRSLLSESADAAAPAQTDGVGARPY
jgi:4-hydroxy-2-oxoheptanedioate aldolase